MTRQKTGRETARNRVKRETNHRKSATGREEKEGDERLRESRDSECCDASLLGDSLTPQIKLRNEDK